ncbi:C69 family dipeptidase [Aeromonas sp. sia0103]|uniref:C69 family dipeptidase n=1 Tax=Aeromonas sp. sia0103 TaxID=2854782 RepID=UPI001C44B2F3|nr:C69 family dipeptidase [Aeromonas sp. sia0103]MBV7599106.1 C69 family dipeptidase [Aeromonas sp. sia0103]
MKIHTLSLLSATLIGLLGTRADACTGLIVGKGASADGSIMIARNEDFGVNNWNKYLVFRSAQQNEGKRWRLGNGLEVPMPKAFLAYSAIRDWDAATSDPAGKYYEERGINEFNVALSATTSAEVNERAQKADPLIEKGVIEAIIPSLILPQARTAKEGVELLGHYVETHGAGEGNSLYLADVNEAWLMEIGSGHHWIAVRVPDDSYAMVANGLRIHGVNLDSPDVLHSPRLLEFVREHKLLDKADPSDFNFAKAFGVIADPYNVDREWLGQQLLTASHQQPTRQAQYPLFMKPDAPIAVPDVTRLLSATYQGTPLEGKADRPIRIDRQLESHIIQLRKEMPKELQGLIWQSYGVLAESVMVPLYNTLESYPLPYSTGSDSYSDDSAYWQFRSLTALSSTQPDKYLPLLRGVWGKQSDKLYKEVAVLDQALKQTYASDKGTALRLASDYSYGQLEQSYQLAKDLRYKLMTDLTKRSEKKYSEAEFKKIMSL